MQRLGHAGGMRGKAENFEELETYQAACALDFTHEGKERSGKG
jgi:hypothetical protein